MEQMTITENDLLSPAKIAAIIESLLFVADHPVSVSELATTLDVSNTIVEQALALLQDEYQDRSLQIQRKGSRMQFVTTPEVTGYIERFLGLSASSKLSAAALETLGIVAYKQPITRPEIEAIRGVNSDGVLRTLLSKGLIEEVGRLDTVGHPIQYGTTFAFLQYFGIASLDQLPQLALDGDGEAALEPLLSSSQSAETDNGEFP